jgi:hypothetical protein
MMMNWKGFGRILDVGEAKYLQVLARKFELE